MIETVHSGGVLIATMTRAPHNTLDDALCAAMDRVLDEAAEHRATVLHLRSTVQSFCGGADPSRIQAWLDPEQGIGEAVQDSARWNRLFARLESGRTVVLAEIGGGALGAGLGLALACDLRIASVAASFGAPEARFGLLALGGTIARLTQRAGDQVARRLLLAGEIVQAEEARDLGLLDWVTGAEELPGRARALAERVAACSPGALAEVRELLARPLPPGDEFLGKEAAATGRLLSLSDTQRRCSALLERLAGRGGRR